MTQSTSGANGAAMPNSSVEQHLTFVLAGELFAIPILSVQEIRGWEAVSRIPQSPDYVLGVINLRGQVVPVLDLRTRLSIERCEKTSTTVVIVVRIQSGDAPVTVGCVVDAVSDVVNIDATTVSAPPAVCGSVDTHFLHGLSSLEDRLVMLLDLSRLIDEQVALGVAA